MTGIVFEHYAPETLGTGYGKLPSLRGWGTTADVSTGVGFGTLPVLRQMRGSGVITQQLPALRQFKVFGSQQPQQLPRLRGWGTTDDVSTGVGFGTLPTLIGFGSADIVPQISIGFGTLPKLVGVGSAKFEMAGVGYGVLPSLKGRGLVGVASGFGFGVLPRLRGFGMAVSIVGAAYISIEQSPGIAYMVGDANTITLLDSGLAFDDALACEVVYGLRETLRLGDDSGSLLDAMVALNERITFNALVRIAYKLVMTETIGLAGNMTAWREVVSELVDALALAAGARSTWDAQVMLASALAFGDSLARAVAADVADVLALSASQRTTLDATIKLLDTFRLQDTLPAPSLTLTALVDESLALGADLGVQQELRALLADGIEFLAQVTLDDGVYLAWVVNTESKAFTSYTNYPFNSFATINGKTYGAKRDGLYVLEGDTDAGQAIEAFARAGLSDLGSSKLKRMPSAYLGYTTDGRMVMKVTVVDDEGIRQEHWYGLEDRAAGSLRESRVKLGRGLKSTYWGFELANVDGADFALDAISWYPMVLDRRL